MHFGFNTHINIQNNPVFLYFLTVAYFSTYCVLCSIAFRLLRHYAAPLAYVVAPLAMAFLETLLNANPFTRSLFCYDDMGFALWFGTLSYGVSFMFALPMWMAIDEEPERRVSARTVVIMLLAAVYADLLVLEVVRHLVAPHFTTVIHGANGLRDVGTSCLQPLR